MRTIHKFTSVIALSVIAVVFVFIARSSLASSGDSVVSPAGGLGAQSGAAPSVVSTTAPPRPTVTLPIFRDSPELPSADAYPVLEFRPGDDLAAMRLEPGTYWIRHLPAQAQWPVQCLSLLVVGEPDDGDRGSIPLTEEDVYVANLDEWYTAAKERANAEQELRRGLCGAFEQALEIDFGLPSAPSRPPIATTTSPPPSTAR